MSDRAARFTFWIATGIALVWLYTALWQLVGQPIAAHVLSLFDALGGAA